MAAATAPASVPKLFKSHFRVLDKAETAGCVRRAGAYSDVPQNRSAKEPGFDWPLQVDRCIAKGLLAPGVAFNTYVLTERGKAALAAAREEQADA
ncbi:hypothetical protein [Roseomonas elaeocarpi]|uniref:DNA-binding protein n=1 Tax=Roseomonas elaeocarpi TaxID=907779 RepID=A0ABV6JTN7_9PROT